MSYSNDSNIQSNIHALTAERAHLLRKLNSKPPPHQSSSSSSTGSSSSVAQLKQKEEGFNVFINGANEGRIEEQRKRELLRRAVPRPKLKSWHKPLVQRVSNNDAGNRSGAVHAGAENREQTEQTRQKRKQWTKTTERPQLALDPLNSSLLSQLSVDDSVQHQLQNREQEEEEMELEEGVEEEYFEEGDGDSATPPSPSPVNDTTYADDFELMSPQLKGYQAPPGARVEQQDKQDSEEEEDTAGSAAAPSYPLSPAPLAVRKRDVSILRESLEQLSNVKPARALSPEDLVEEIVQELEQATADQPPSTDAEELILRSTLSSSPSPPPRSSSPVLPPSKSAASAASPRPKTPSEKNTLLLKTSLILSQSFDQHAVESMLIRFCKLPKRKKEILMRVLGNLEQGADVSDIDPELVSSLQLLRQVLPSHQHKHLTSQSKDAAQSSLSPPAHPLPSSHSSSPALPNSNQPATLSSNTKPSQPLSQQPSTSIKPAASIPIPSAVPSSTSTSAVPSTNAANAVIAETASPSPSPEDVVIASFAPPKPTLSIQLLSNYGHSTLLGLAQIELYAGNSRLTVPPSLVQIEAPGLGKIDCTKLCSYRSQPSLDERHMWRLSFPSEFFDQQSVAIRFFLPAHYPRLTQIVLWNYNGSAMHELSMGVQHIQISVLGRLVYDGTLAQGSGDDTTDTSLSLALPSGQVIKHSSTLATKADIDNAVSTTSTAATNSSSLPSATSISSSISSSSLPPTSTSSSATTSNSASARPLWLSTTSQSTPASANESGSAGVTGSVSMHHSSSASTLPPRAHVRRGSHPSRELLLTADAANKLREDAQDENVKAGEPPLVPTNTWHSSEQEINIRVSPEPNSNQVPLHARRPISGRRAGLNAAVANAQTAAGTRAVGGADDTGSAGPSPIPTSDSSVSARPGRRRPTMDTAITLTRSSGISPVNVPADSSITATSTAPSSSKPTFSSTATNLPVSQPATNISKSATSEVPVAANFRKRRSDLEESWDSLEHFRQHHKGRLAAEADSNKNDADAEEKENQRSLSAEPSSASSSDADDDAVPDAFAKSAPFVMPTLPHGYRLIFELQSTHGDQYYVGLNGIELYDGTGNLITFPSPSSSIRASPSDLNVLRPDKKDPRVISNLLDGNNCTCDDMHLWLAPYSAGKRHYIQIDLPNGETLSMIRIWNYNKSRIHSARGVKLMEIWMDEKMIFKGEIQQAPGNVQQAPQYAENILFTTNSGVIGTILHNTRQLLEAAQKEEAGQVDADFTVKARSRPPTAGESQDPLSLSLTASIDFDVDRPATSAVMSAPVQIQPSANTQAPIIGKAIGERVQHAGLGVAPVPTYSTVTGRELTLYLLCTWGDNYYVGLSGLQILDKKGVPIPLSVDNLSAFPRDINAVPGHSGDNRTLDK